MAAQNPSSAGHRSVLRRWLLVCGGVIAIVSGAAGYLALHWPFAPAAVTASLEAATSSKVEVGSFRNTYWPHPGCIARQVIVHQGFRTDIAPLITIEQLTLQSSILEMLTKHVGVMRADGIRIFIPRQSEQNFRFSTDVVVDKLIANEASLRFERRATAKPLEFKIHKSELSNVGAPGPLHFRVRVTNPEPPGEIEASGTFGPWLWGRAGQTRVSGQYTFQRADLSVFRGIAGNLSSKGSFDGTLQHIAVEGSTDTSEFTVTSSRHRVELKTQFKAVVNGTNGDVALQQVDSQFRRTKVSGKGEIAEQPGKAGRAAVLDLCSKDGRIQDLLLLFITADRSPMTGTTNFCAHVTIPSGKRPFLRKVELVGDFGIDIANFTKAQTQEDVNKLSAESEGGDDDDPATVLSSLRGHVEIQEGTARFNSFSFGIPGAMAAMHGTYDLASHKVDLHGTLKMDSSPSHMAHGPKALILKFMDPFFKKEPRGSEVPVKITGTYEHPSFGLDLHGQKQTSASKRLQRLYQRTSKTQPMGRR